MEPTAETDDSTATSGTIDVSSIAPDAVAVDEASELDHRWRYLVWAEPGMGKSHFAYTMPEPVIFIDTEHKAHDLAGKFKHKEVYLFQVDDYDEMVDSLKKGLEVLDAFRTQADQVGSIVIDSMTDAWEMAQQHYVDIYKKTDDLEEARKSFKSGLQGGNDWQTIKSFHNSKFRDLMTDSPYHFCWTAKSQRDYESQIEDGEEVYTASGEKNNRYHAAHVIRIHGDENDVPTASLQKSDLTRATFNGMAYPDHEKVSGVLKDIVDAEESPESIPVDQITDYDVTIDPHK